LKGKNVPARSPVTSAAFIAQARRCLGRPYLYGAAGPGEFDCSGLVQWCLKQTGISAPRTSEEQFAWTERAQTAMAGDLVFFQGAELDPPPGHVGIVVAPGVMIDAPHTGAVVMQANFGTSGTGVNRFMGYGRIPGLVGSSANQAIITGQGQSGSVRQQTAITGGWIGIVFFFIVLVMVAVLIMLLLIAGMRYAT
jgi:hypothetical protein